LAFCPGNRITAEKEMQRRVRTSFCCDARAASRLGSGSDSGNHLPLLLSAYGRAVRAAGMAGGQTQRIAKAIERLKRDYAQALRVAQLARSAGMSDSYFHDQFKRITTLSPGQYQKQLRLQAARPPAAR
jgi:hypothetical protein